MPVTLLGAAEIRALAAELDVTPTKKLGQNFVVDANTVRKIVQVAHVSPGERVVEVGPGLGSLTLAILEAGASVTAVEIDHRLAERLPQTAAAHGVADGALTVIDADALRVTELPGDPTVLVANLPYNVSVPVLLHLLETFPGLQRGVVMVQAEVGERLAAPPGSKIYGAPSVKAAWYGRWRLAGTVSRQVFWPVPNVDSVLVGFHRGSADSHSADSHSADSHSAHSNSAHSNSAHSNSAHSNGADSNSAHSNSADSNGADSNSADSNSADSNSADANGRGPRGDDDLRRRTFRIVDAAFQQRRKMLRQALAAVLGGTSAEATAVLERAGVAPTARGEELSIDDFVRIALAV